VKIAPADLDKLQPTVRKPKRALASERVVKARHVCGADRHCDRREVLAADRRLRRAYAAAVKAGVARPVLVEYRDDWARLRRRAPREPARVVSGYGRMASALERPAQVQRTADERPLRRDDGWRHLGREIASLLP
jgi:hypothetical protein